MTLSEYIKELQRMQAEKGDLPLLRVDRDEEPVELDKVEFAEVEAHISNIHGFRQVRIVDYSVPQASHLVINHT